MAKKNKSISDCCPQCRSPDIEPSWGSEGYIQCNTCGAEWLQGKTKKVDWKNLQRDQQRAVKHLKQLDMRRKMS